MKRFKLLKAAFSLFAIGLISLAAAPMARAADLNLNIVNENPKYDKSQVYVLFWGGVLNATATVNGAADTPLNSNISYQLSSLSNIKLKSPTTGKVFISLGGATKQLPPNFNNQSLPDYNLRWDKIELTFDGSPWGCANLSATDFFGVPLKLTNSKNDTLKWNESTATIFSKLADIAHNDASTVIRGDQGVNGIVRIISPSTTTNPNAYAPDAKTGPFADYIKSMKGKTTPIEGTFVGTPQAPYAFKAVVQQSGDLVMDGTIGGVQTNITIKSGDLPIGIYTCNPPFSVNGASSNMGKNDAACAVVRDALAAFNLGFLGSTVTNPNTGQSIGSGPSNKWDGLDKSKAYAGAQPNNPTYYNQYAAYLAGVSDAYGFPFTDFVYKPLLTLDPSKVNSMTITVQPD